MEWMTKGREIYTCFLNDNRPGDIHMFPQGSSSINGYEKWKRISEAGIIDDDALDVRNMSLDIVYQLSHINRHYMAETLNTCVVTFRNRESWFQPKCRIICLLCPRILVLFVYRSFAIIGVWNVI